MMENADEEDDLKLVKASAGLLADLGSELPKLLWKRPGEGSQRRAHTKVKKRHLDRVVNLIEPFQGEPQLLDAKLKTFLPPIVDAYLENIGRDANKTSDLHDIEAAVCSLLYTFCKVRGVKVIVGFLSNEPRYLEPILEALEATLLESQDHPVTWQVPYILLLWLSHLLLTPFPLESISTKHGTPLHADDPHAHPLPALARRILTVGLAYLPASTKAQEAAAALLVRLCIRPDVLPFRLADRLVDEQLPKLGGVAADVATVYEALGSLRLVSGIAAASELSHLVPNIYQNCKEVFDEEGVPLLSSNAVAKKIAIKLFRSVSILSMRSAASAGPLLSFVQSTSVLEDVIDYLLRSLGDRDTPVRYAAAKAISLVVLELEPEMGHEVIQAVLDSFKEDMPRTTSFVDFSTVDPLRWHGLTLALAHSLFKRSASPKQLPDIFDALISALQFQQRTATRTTLGTNVRDAANFGIWSLARRFTTAELLPVQVHGLHKSNQVGDDTSIIQLMATQLVLSSCLDPAGNIRRGSSAALQELVGRHPDQVFEGIALVQIVDYQAVSLRKRAMVDVANRAAKLHPSHAASLVDGLFDWRGLWSADVTSRESAAAALSNLASTCASGPDLLQRTLRCIKSCDAKEVENLHGYVLTASKLIGSVALQDPLPVLSDTLVRLEGTTREFSARTLRSELPASTARFTTALCVILVRKSQQDLVRLEDRPTLMGNLEIITERLLAARHESWILDTVPDLVRSLLHLKRFWGQPLDCIGVQHLCKKASVDGSKSTRAGAGGVIALGALAGLYSDEGLVGDKAASAVQTLASLLSAMNVDWRVTAASALELAVESVSELKTMDKQILDLTCAALRQGLNDYTIDERGDVGSLVRLQCISCSSKLLANTRLFIESDSLRQQLRDEIARLSLEKLDRVRLQAARCREDFSNLELSDIASVSSPTYFRANLKDFVYPQPAHDVPPDSQPQARQEALLQGLISCAGIGAEPLLQSSRQVFAEILQDLDADALTQVLTSFTRVLNRQLTENVNMHPGLELLAFILDTTPRLPSSFKWRGLLSIVQKSHHKSNDIPKILAAVHVYIGLAGFESVRRETLKKLVSMLKTNPYPRVRIAVAEALFVFTGREELKKQDWARPIAQLKDIVGGLEEALLGA